MSPAQNLPAARPPLFRFIGCDVYLPSTLGIAISVALVLLTASVVSMTSETPLSQWDTFFYSLFAGSLSSAMGLHVSKGLRHLAATLLFVLTFNLSMVFAMTLLFPTPA